ncbi:hypothetical protein B0H34DRAFT_719321, partial [Crassisporium funariophilum]
MDSFITLFATLDPEMLAELSIEGGIDSKPEISDIPFDEDSPYRPPTWCTIA